MTEAWDANLATSLLLVATLGFRHGFDADHIAVVDGMTRARQVQGFWTSRLVGAQFAIGHSSVILLASLLLHGQSAALPQWLDGVGMAISACFLLVIATSNLAYALRTAGNVQRPMGPLASTIMRVSGGHLHPALVGMAFAFSFDTMAQAAFFASRGSQLSGQEAVFLLAATFGLGMVLSDAANGALLYWFTSRSDRLARHASRFSSGFIAAIAFMTVGAGIARALHKGFAEVWDGSGAWIGVAVVALTTGVYTVRILVQKARAQRARLS